MSILKEIPTNFLSSTDGFADFYGENLIGDVRTTIQMVFIEIDQELDFYSFNESDSNESKKNDSNKYPACEIYDANSLNNDYLHLNLFADGSWSVSLD